MVLCWAAVLSLVRPCVVGPARSGHATATLGERVLVFGGLTGAAGAPASRDLWTYGSGAWTNHTRAHGPSARMYAAMAALGGRAFLFGGWDPGAPGSGGEFKDDVWWYDPLEDAWTEVGRLPRAASRHTACTVGDRIVLQTFEGTLVCGFDGRVVAQPTTGPGPDGLSMSCAAAVDDSRMLVFGGSTREQQMSGDAYLLDTDTWEWTLLEAEGDAPTPRAGAAGCAVAPGAVCVCGGAGMRDDGYAGGAGLLPYGDLFVGALEGTGAIRWARVDAARLPACVAGSATVRRREVVLHGGYDPVARRALAETRCVRLDALRAPRPAA